MSFVCVTKHSLLNTHYPRSALAEILGSGSGEEEEDSLKIMSTPIFTGITDNYVCMRYLHTRIMVHHFASHCNLNEEKETA